ncbi:MAG TPA: DUF5700 domain-containing putative Zn-dependent protease, partial [Terriglobales bacterium]
DWQKVFTSEPYVRLKQREASMKRNFTDDDFKTFVMSDDLLHRVPALKQTLAAWKRADLNAAAERVLAYLPASAVIHARIYPVIKPMTNSFVWEAKTNAAIFLFIDPDKSSADFENTVAHELHHIGFASVKQDLAATANLSPEAKATVDWMGGFGEGMAMLAAAGSPDVHPHAHSKPDVRARWDRDMTNFNHDLKQVEVFFFDILNGKLKTEEEQSKVGMEFFGVQGPWYTVGYKMASMVEKRFGRPALIETMSNYPKLLLLYNQAAAEQNAKGGEQLATWSPELLKRVRVQ